jgi:hypothetical protein
MYVLDVRPAPQVSDQPRVTLTDWCVFRSGDDRFLAGVLANGTTMRCTTAVRTMDPFTKIWVTSSGRRYETTGSPARPEVRALLQVMACGCWGTGDVEDATGELLGILNLSEKSVSDNAPP